MNIIKSITSVFENKSQKISTKNRVIIVDDDPYFLEFITETLKTIDITVEIYNDSEQAKYNLSSYRNHDEILCIISDVMMDSIDGIELFSMIRNIKPLEKTHFLFLSAVEETFIQQFVELNRNVSFIQKPFQPEDLRMYIKKLKNQFNQESL